MHLRQYSALPYVQDFVHKVPTVYHYRPSISFRDTDEMPITLRSVTGVKRLYSAQYNGTNDITHNIKLSYCRKLLISYRLNEFGARSVVTDSP